MSTTLEYSSSTRRDSLLFSELSSLLNQAREGKKLSSEPVIHNVAKLSRILDRPPIVELETVNICNSKCEFCISREQVAKKAVMDEELFDSITSQISKFGTGELCLVPMLGAFVGW